jgi:hypothetical protein
MKRTRSEDLRFSIAFALGDAVKVVRGLRKGLTEAERYAVADQVVYRLKKYGDAWELDKELPQRSPVESGAALPVSLGVPNVRSCARAIQGRSVRRRLFRSTSITLVGH